VVCALVVASSSAAAADGLATCSTPAAQPARSGVEYLHIAFCDGAYEAPVSATSHVTVDKTGALFRYRVEPGYTGVASFTFTPPGQDAVVVRLDASPTANRDPSCTVDNRATRLGSTRPVELECPDPEGDAVTVRVGTPPAAGALGTPARTRAGKWRVPYTAPADFGDERFLLIADDGYGAAVPLLVVAQLLAPDYNTPPNCFGGSAAVYGDLPSKVWGMCWDAEGDPSTVQVLTPPEHGTLASMTSTLDGIEQYAFLSYTPTNRYRGPDHFTFQATDDHGGVSQVGTADIAVNDALPGQGVLPPATTPPATTPPAAVPADTTAPNVALSISRQRARSVARRGLLVRHSCDEDCHTKVTVRRSTGKSPVGTGTFANPVASARVTLTRSARAALRDNPRTRLRVAVVAIDAAGNVAHAAAQVTVRRRDRQCAPAGRAPGCTRRSRPRQ
jgi:hypothetical protein